MAGSCAAWSARSRNTRAAGKAGTEQILSGFGITKLVTECFRGDANREDKSALRHDEGDPGPAELRTSSSRIP